MISKITLSGILTFVSIFMAGEAQGQCCAAGNPLSSDVDFRNLGKNYLKVGISYAHSYSDTYYQRDSPVDVGGVDHSFFDYTEINLYYGLSQRISIRADLGYFFDKAEIYLHPQYKKLNGSGLGDLALQIRYLIYKDFTKQWEISGGMGIKFPVGVFDQVVDNVKLPINLQPSSGSFKYFANIFFAKRFKNRLQLFSYNSAEISQTIDSKNFYYRYGNLFTASMGVSYPVLKKVNTGLQLRGEFRNNSTRENEQTVEASGGTLIYVIPQISMNTVGKINLAVSVNLPVYGYFNGIQLANKYLFHISVSRNFDFNK